MSILDRSMTFDTPRGPVRVTAKERTTFAFELPSGASFGLLFDENGALTDEIPSITVAVPEKDLGGGVVIARKLHMQTHSPSTITTITDGLSLAMLLDFVNQLRAKFN